MYCYIQNTYVKSFRILYIVDKFKMARDKDLDLISLGSPF